MDVEVEEEAGWGVRVDGLDDDKLLIIILNSSNISSCDFAFNEILADCPSSMSMKQASVSTYSLQSN